MWRKLFDRRPEYSLYADKYGSRAFVKEKGLGSILIELHGVYGSVDEIVWSSLPNSFVIKTNHDSGTVCIVKDKTDEWVIAQTKKKLQLSLLRNYYRERREWHYRDIEPRIMIERMLVDEKGRLPIDYKFYCIDSKVEFVHVVNSDHATAAVFDVHWNRLEFDYNNLPTTETPSRPIVFDEMVEVAEKLSADMDFVRIDLYTIDSLIFYGEITVTPNGGFGRFSPASYDLFYGRKISKPKLKQKQ